MAQSAAPAESPLPPAILRSLGDRSYDKRKNAALEIEALIKALQENNDTDRICSVIAMLGWVFNRLLDWRAGLIWRGAV
jgi:vacuole morphology and inheritance protein 14